MRAGIKDPAVAAAFDEINAIPGWLATVVFSAATDDVKAGDTRDASAVRIGQVAELASQLLEATGIDLLDENASGQFCGATVKWAKTAYVIQWIGGLLYAAVVLDRAEKNIALAMNHLAKLVAVADRL